MMNIVWAIMTGLGLIFGIVTGKADILVQSMAEGCGEAVSVCLGLAGAMMLWNGFMEVAKDLGVIDNLAKLIYPFMKRLFPNSEKAIAPITLNLAANFFGMGSAATPFGIEAMQKLEEENKTPGIASNNMCMFIALNASALELLPTTILALMSAQGASQPYLIVVPTAIASVVSFAVAIFVCKLLERIKEPTCS